MWCMLHSLTNGYRQSACPRLVPPLTGAAGQELHVGPQAGAAGVQGAQQAFGAPQRVLQLRRVCPGLCRHAGDGIEQRLAGPRRQRGGGGDGGHPRPVAGAGADARISAKLISRHKHGAGGGRGRNRELRSGRRVWGSCVACGAYVKFGSVSTAM